ncbi:acetyl-CoA synthetase-like protein [Dentipellis sp. KUC8613]|nr:acetyl-CoA synthetase-like protein [Dentipellis sp. KUC8613]
MDSSKFRTHHGQHSTTFTPAPTDRFLTIPQLHEFNAKHSPDHPLFVYNDDDGKEVVIDRARGWEGMRRASQLVWDRCKLCASSPDPTAQPLVIGILAVADTVSYMCATIGIMRLGFTPFPISPRNSAAAVAHLVEATGLNHMLVSPDSSMRRLSEEAAEMLGKDGIEFDVLPMVQFGELFPSDDQEALNLDAPVREFGAEEVALILHSSGSTAFPKPIKIRARTFVQWGYYLSFGEVDFCDLRLSLQTAPVFPRTILNVDQAATGVVLTCYKPSVPPVVPTPENFLASIVATRSDIAYGVPAFIEAWARDPENIPILQSLKAVIYGGAPLHPETGEKLAKAGVNVVPFYGATETGGIGVLVPKTKPTPDTVGYFTFSAHIDVVLRPQDGADDLFEPVFLESNPDLHSLNASTSIVNGHRAYETKDLVQRHPTVPHLWRVYGRTDDQIMLSTGEKTNPGPIEAILALDPHIAAALLFGRGKFQNGVLVQPAAAHAFDPRDTQRLDAFRDAIWPTVEKANAFAPSHSRLFKEMILTTRPSTPFEYTAKGSPRRHVSLGAYSGEIDALYADADADASLTDADSERVDADVDLRGAVRGVVARVMRRRVADDEDLFQAGCDSLQATWIRNSLSHAIRTTPTPTPAALPHDVVYTHPSVGALADFILGLQAGAAASGAGGNDGDADAAVREKVRQMEALVEKYTAGLDALVFCGEKTDDRSTDGENGSASASASENGTEHPGDTILITGTTGRLGSWVLSLLLQDASVRRVYALNRGGGEPLRARQRAAFARWGLDAGLLETARAALVEGDAADPRLGLRAGVYEEIRRTVTGIIINGWRVDFNVSLATNEPLLRGVRHLIALAQSAHAPVHLLFVSSVSVVRNLCLRPPAAERPLPSAHAAVGTGYSESKWVAERMLARVHTHPHVHSHSHTHIPPHEGIPPHTRTHTHIQPNTRTRTRATIVRVGQLAGDVGVGAGERGGDVDGARGDDLDAAHGSDVDIDATHESSIDGGTARGGWSGQEWVPALLRAGQVLGCLPLRDERVTWLPVDTAARALLELFRAPPPPNPPFPAPSPVSTPSTPPFPPHTPPHTPPHGHTPPHEETAPAPTHDHTQIFHLVHPRPARWDTLIARAAARLGGLPLVGYAEWVARLRRACAVEGAGAGEQGWEEGKHQEEEEHEREEGGKKQEEEPEKGKHEEQRKASNLGPAASLLAFFEAGAFGEDVRLDTARAAGRARAGRGGDGSPSPRSGHDVPSLGDRRTHAEVRAPNVPMHARARQRQGRARP